MPSRIATIAAFFALAASSAHAQFAGPQQLKLINGWTNAPFSTSKATVEKANNIVQFRGAIATSGTNVFPFTLVPAFRPLTDVYVPIDLCNATKGRLHITSAGIVDVEVENGTPFSNAQCFTSLDGASFAARSNGFAGLALVNGWTNAPFSTSNAAVSLIDGVVHFKGAIGGGTANVVFTLPAAYRPATDVYIPVDLCGATNGRLHITPAGVTDVEPENGTFSNAQCFTSLDGATFVPNATGATALTLINGWTNAPFSTSNAAAEGAYGVVHFKGAIATTGTNTIPFVLPPAFRPVTAVYVAADLCNAHNGRLFIQTDGTVSVQAEGGTFSNAQCFTSLDGVNFKQ